MAELIDVEIKDVIRRTYNVKSIRFANNKNIVFKAGQFLTVSFDGTKELSRYLSISNSPTEKGYIEVTKKLTGSVFSFKIDQAKPGDRMKISLPMGNFVYKDKYEKLAFLSGGIGITPLRSISRYLTDAKPAVSMALLYANHESRDIAFKDDLDTMTKINQNLKIVYVLCSNDEKLTCRIGRIDSNVVKEEINDYKDRFFMLCGPPGMVQAMKTMLSEELKLPAAQIITENFTGY